MTGVKIYDPATSGHREYRHTPDRCLMCGRADGTHWPECIDRYGASKAS